jgi:hypothetical protein
MTWSVTIHTSDKDLTYHIPFECYQIVYYAHKKKPWKNHSKWVITKSTITGMWATNTYGVILSSSTYICEDDFHRLFINREEAIEFCLKKNAHAKVKIYGE